MVVVGLISAVAGAEAFTALTTVRPIRPSRPVRSKSQGPAVSSSRRVKYPSQCWAKKAWSDAPGFSGMG